MPSRCRPRSATSLKDPGAQEYAANQTREEARHVTAFAAYIKSRWGTPTPCGATLQNMLTEIVNAPEVYKKIVGMQMLVEGLAMGAFATLYQKSQDPLLVKLCQLVMTDEAFHHKFGKIWADRTIPKLSAEEHNIVEDWAAQCFQTLLFNLVNAEQMQTVYTSVGIDWQDARAAIMEAYTDDDRREGHDAIDQHLPRAHQDAAQCRHHHRPHPCLLCDVCEHG
ncbi:MAG: ferritin-like domain-containing protein [Rhizomicrobium sp.]